jgi:hypothetical protein
MKSVHSAVWGHLKKRKLGHFLLFIEHEWFTNHLNQITESSHKMKPSKKLPGSEVRRPSKDRPVPPFPAAYNCRWMPSTVR